MGVLIDLTDRIPSVGLEVISMLHSRSDPFPLRFSKDQRQAPGAHPRGGGVRGPPNLGPEKHYIFRDSSAKLRDLHL